MWRALTLGLLGLLGGPVVAAEACAKNLDFTFRSLGGEDEVRLCDRYQGKVVLVVNTASKCAFTPQYDGLEALYRRYRDRGLVVVGFPSNDFANQEPGTEAEIQRFCRLTYGVEFPMYEKTRVARGNANPFYEQLAEAAGEYPRWNFHKYLLDANGNLVGSFPSQIAPENPRLVDAIEKQLRALEAGV